MIIRRDKKKDRQEIHISLLPPTNSFEDPNFFCKIMQGISKKSGIGI